MAKNDYRHGRKQVNVLVGAVLHRQMVAAAEASGVGSLQAWMVEAFREKVMQGGAAGDGPAERDGDATRHEPRRVADLPRLGGVGPDGRGEPPVRLTDSDFMAFVEQIEARA